MGSSGLRYGVEVEGLDELLREVAAAQIELPALISKANADVAYIVMAETRERMQALFVLPASERTGALIHSTYVDEEPTFTEAGIGGRTGDGVPYAGWWEYGGDNKSPIGESMREFVKGGRTLYPAIRANREKIRAIYTGVATRVRRRFL